MQLRANGEEDRLYVHNQGNGRYAIQVEDGSWLNIESRGHLFARSKNGDDPPQHFWIFDRGDGTVAIHDYHGGWLFADGDDREAIKTTTA